MLALSRKKGESIIIGDHIEIVVLSVSGDQVKLGIAAPRSIAVNRKEIYEQIQIENRKAATAMAVAPIDVDEFNRLINMNTVK